MLDVGGYIVASIHVVNIGKVGKSAESLDVYHF